MGKTAAGAIWLSPEKTSAFEFYQFWYNVEDSRVEQFLKLFTELPLPVIAEKMAQGVIEAKRTLALHVTTLIHGQEPAATAAAMGAAGITPEGEGALPVHEIDEAGSNSAITLARLLVDCKLATSRSAARRLADGGGVRINGAQARDLEVFCAQVRFGPEFTLSVGKKKAVLVRFIQP